MGAGTRSSSDRRRLGVLFSGTGRTLENLAVAIAEGRLDAELAVAITDREDALGIEKARALGLATAVHDPKALGPSFSETIAATLRRHGVGTVVLAGFLKLWEIPADFERDVLNIHPSLLPAFGGKGFYGMRVHRAVHAAGVRFTGCTVHYADREYDRGPIILQRIVAVEWEDTPETIAAKVFAEECIAYPRALSLHLRGALDIQGGRVRVLETAP